MKLKTAIAAAFAVALSCVQAFGQATILPPGETCFQATTGINGMVGLLGSITGGSLYTTGTYGGVSLTGGSGSGATANITVSGGAVTAVAILNPGTQYVVGDVLSAAAANIGGTGSGFSVPVSSTSINSSLAGGTIGFFIPNTLSVKQTWQDAGELTLNTNPVGLDQNGCAVIYGAGIYRSILKDSLGNTVFDKLTASTGGGGAGGNGIFWAGLATGTGNAISIVDTSFALQDGATIQFLAKAVNTGPVTISVSGGTPIAIVNDTSAGPAALTGGEIGPGNTPMITYDATSVQFHIVNPSATASSSASTSLTPPQGYLNLVGQASGDVIQTGDVTAVSTIFYSPFVGANLPIWNGTVFVQTAFSELTATLTIAGSPLSSIQDACVFSNNGVPTLAIGPAWTTATAGAGNRGTGVGTAQITRLQGIWVNATAITGYNGLSSFSIGANRCTIVGSISIDATAGQVSALRTWGKARKYGIWNFYNRQNIFMQEGDNTASWTSTTTFPTFAPPNADATNLIAAFTGLPEEQLYCQYNQAAQQLAVNRAAYAALGVNSTTTLTGTYGRFQGVGSDNRQTMTGFVTIQPALGINNIQALNASDGVAVTYIGTQPAMTMNCQYRG